MTSHDNHSPSIVVPACVFRFHGTVFDVVRRDRCGSVDSKPGRFTGKHSVGSGDDSPGLVATKQPPIGAAEPGGRQSEANPGFQISGIIRQTSGLPGRRM
jgi:hypothetical protein